MVALRLVNRQNDGLRGCISDIHITGRNQELGDDKYRPCPLLRQHVAAGWLGRKVGRGFYQYDENGRKLLPQQ